MCFRCLSLMLAGVLGAMAADQRVLRVCADPNNLPYSNQRGEGFENRLAEMAARDLGAKLEYIWWSQRRSFIRNSLDEGKCDAVMGVPSDLNSVEVTKPYYRSTYVFLTRKDRDLRISSLFDSSLEKLRIGIHLVGDGYAPPAHALTQHGLAPTLVGYSLYGEYGAENPPARLVDAVARGDVDIAIVWGPFAGYFAKKSKVALDITRVSPPMYLAVPFTYEMSAGVRKGNHALRAELDDVLGRECAAIKALLDEYGIPLVGQEEREKCEPPPH